MKLPNRFAHYDTPGSLRQRFPVSKAVPSLMPYEPANDKIAAFHRAPQKIRALFGGNRSGKTESGIYHILSLAVQTPGVVIWICTVTNEMIGANLWPKIKKYLAPDQIASISWLNPSRRIPGIIRLPNDSQIVCKSYEQGREAFQGTSVFAILHDEEPPEGIYEESLARLVDTGGNYVLTMTPIKGMTWVYDRIFKAENPDIAHWTVSQDENKFLSAENRAWFRRQLGQDEVAKRIEGQFVRLEGLVFKEFKSEVNVIEPFPIPNEWRIFRGIDFGYVNPFCCLWAAVNPENEIFVYQERYASETLLGDHAKIILQMDTQGVMRPEIPIYFAATVADHDAQDRAELESCGIYTEPAQKDVELGIQVVNRMLKSKPNGRPGIYLFRTLTHAIKEIGQYHYEPTRGDRNGKETPAKINDHAMDALRYLCMAINSGMSDAPPDMAMSSSRTF